MSNETGASPHADTGTATQSQTAQSEATSISEEKLAAVVNAAVTSHTKRLEKRFEERLAEKEKQISEMLESGGKKPQSDVERRLAKYEADLLAERQARQAVEKERTAEKKVSFLLQAISAHDVHDTATVAELLGRHVGINDKGKPIVLDADGDEILGASVEDFIASFLKERKWLLKGSGASGAGTAAARGNGAPSGQGVDVESILKMPATSREYMEARKAGKLAAFGIKSE